MGCTFQFSTKCLLRNTPIEHILPSLTFVKAPFGLAGAGLLFSSERCRTGQFQLYFVNNPNPPNLDPHITPDKVHTSLKPLYNPDLDLSVTPNHT